MANLRIIVIDDVINCHIRQSSSFAHCDEIEKMR